ncbi:MAG: GLUG motif-containing protein, partial [Bacillota bacterium]|nr:GLUG motif-containing protein [Bacillota bacterium]
MKTVLRKLLSMLLVLFLITALLPCSVSAVDGDVCEIVGGPSYSTLDGALDAVQDGETIKLLQDIDHNSGISIVDKHITFDMNGCTLNVVNSALEDTFEEMSGLFVQGNAGVALVGEGEFNVTGSWYGVFAECDSGETLEVTVTNATGNGRDGVAAQGSKVTVQEDATSNGSGGNGVWASYDAEVTVDGDVYANGERSVGVKAETLALITVNGSVIASGNESIGIEASDDGDVTVEGDVSVSGTDCVGVYLLSEADKMSIVTIKGGIDAEKYALIETEVGECEYTFEEGSINTEVSGDNRYYTEDYESFVYVALFAGGSGTAGDPYLISRGTQLYNIGDYDFIDMHYKQIADIDLGGYFSLGVGWEPIGNGEVPFLGTYDGDGHTISNLTMNHGDSDNIGLFAAIGTGSIIRNVELIDADVTGEGSVGALAGWNNGIVENTYATGEVNGDGYAVGGLIGENDGTVTGSHFDGTIATVEGNESGDFAGGLIGVNYDNGSITDCYAIATVTSEVGYGTGGLVGANYGPINDSHAICSVTGNDTVGGLVGENNIGTIDNSYADGDVTGSSRVGGLTGFNEFAITDSYFTGTVTASDDYSGGLVGESIGSIRDCHADAAVISTADYVGGLAGYSRGASFSYATGSVTGESYVGGLIGESYRNFASDVIDASYSTSAVTGHSHIGGLAGSNEADISASYAKGAVTGVEKAGIDSTYAGGLVGINTGPISNSYAWGDVSGHEYVGGLVGYNEGPDATILNCYEIGTVDGNEGSFVGPLIGLLNLLSSEDIIGSFWNNNTSGHVSSDWGISEGSVTMMQQATYVNEGWNFDTIWGINTVDNNRYPFLRWQFDAEFAGGNGSAENPFLVADADQLNNVRNHLDKHFLQTHDIMLMYGKEASNRKQEIDRQH